MAWEAQFFSINQARDWHRGRMYHAVATESGLSLPMTAAYALEKHLDLTRIFAERMVYGTAALATTLYFMSASSDIWMLDPLTGYTEPVFPLGQRLFSTDAQLAALPNMFIVADTSSGVTAYSSFNRQSVWDFRRYQNTQVTPFTVSTDYKRFTYVLGRMSTNMDAAILILAKIDNNGRVVAAKEIDDADLLQRAQKNGARIAVGTDQLWVWLHDEHKPLGFLTADLTPAIVSGDDEHLRVPLIDLFYGANHQLMAVFPTDDASGTSIVPMDQMTLSEDSENAEQFDAVATQVITDGRDVFILFDADLQRLSVYRYKIGYQRDEETGHFEGVFLTPAFDSLEDGTRWHKVVVDADLPSDCQVSIQYVASDAPMLPVAGQLVVVDDVRLEDMMHASGRYAALQFSFSHHSIVAKDALIDATGRYLWLLVRITGSRSASPLVRRLRVYYPRASYLDFLPSIYQEDGVSKDFLERFLALFNTLSSSLDEQIDIVSHLFDVDTAPAEMLAWLTQWLGFTPDETWTDDQLRDMIRALPELNRLRGTRTGIERIIRLYTGQMPMIVEYPQYASLMAKKDLRELMSRLYGGHSNSFAVLVSADVAPDARHRYVLSKLIERQKPAFTEAKLVILSPFIYIDMHTYLGINTYLSEAKSLHLDGRTVLPHDTIIIDVGAWVTDYGTHD